MKNPKIKQAVKEMRERAYAEAFDYDEPDVEEERIQAQIDELRKGIEGSAAVREELKNATFNFLYEARLFMRSTQFVRFSNMVKQEASKLFQKLGLYRPKDGMLHKEKYVITPKEMVQDAIQAWATVCYSAAWKAKKKPPVKRVEAKTEQVEGCKEPVTVTYTLADFLRGNPMRDTCVIDMIEGGMYDYCKGEPNAETAYVILVQVSAILHDELYDELFEDAWQRAVYTFIKHAVRHDGLTENNWYNALKNVSTNDILTVLNDAFTNTVFNIEDRAGWDIIGLKSKESLPNMLCKFSKSRYSVAAERQKAERQRRTFEKEIEKLKRVNEEQRERIHELQHPKTHQESSAAAKAARQQEYEAAQEKAKMERQLEAERQRADELQRKYDDLLAFVESREEADDEQEDTVVTGDILHSDKRIVFVRDKQAAGFTMMQQLAQCYPNAKFTNSIASDINSQTTDLIVALVAYTCHGTYWRAESIAKRGNVPLLCEKHKNINRINAAINEKFERLNQE